MKTRRKFIAASLAVATGATQLPAGAPAAEWPQWRGPDRTGISRERGLLKQWPQGGPQLAWKAVGLGGGYSTPTVAGGRVYGMGYVGNEEVVWALEAQSSRGLWMTPIATANTRIDHGDGSRSSPTVDGQRLYVLGVSGDFACLSTEGKVVWKRNFVSEFGGQIPPWGYSESPLIDGNVVVATPGGRSAVMVGLNKQTGQTIWSAAAPQGIPAHYASAIAAELDGQRQYVNLTGGGVIGVSARNGQLLWRNSHAAFNTANCSTPIASGSYVFAAAGYGKGGVLLQIQNGQANQVYHTPAMVNHHGGMILLGEHLYGFSDSGGLTCLDLRTGNVAWASRIQKCSLAFADGCLYARAENRGTVTLIEASPQQLMPRGQLEPPDRSGKNTWPHPVIADGKLYLRDQDVLHCYSIRAA